MSDPARVPNGFSAFCRAQPSLDDARARLQTLRDLLRWAVSRFEEAGLAWGQGTETSRDEAAWLLLWSLHLPPDELDFWLDCRLSAPEIDAALALIERRCTERVPAAWLTGETWLRGVRFLCGPRALVPRSLIAEALDDSLDEWLLDWLSDKPFAWGAGPGEGADLAQPDRKAEAGLPRWPSQVLDLCTGGASLAILAARHFPGAAVTASDISGDALALACENVALHEMQDRIRLVQGDLFEALAGECFDLILCNPPYVNAASMAALPAEFLAEHPIALAGGDDGMDFIRRLLGAAAGHLSEHGVLVIEIGHEAKYFEAAFRTLQYDWLAVAAGDRMIVVLTRSALFRSGMNGGQTA